MSEAETDFSDICTACGLCCDGTLFEYAVLKPDDIEAAKAAGLAVGEFAGKPGFAQPCSQVCGTSCGNGPSSRESETLTRQLPHELA